MFKLLTTVLMLTATAALVQGYSCGSWTCSSGQYCCTRDSTGYKSCYYSSQSWTYYTCSYVSSSSSYTSSTGYYWSLSIGGIVGIVIAGLFVCIGGIVGCVFCCCRPNSNYSGRVVGGGAVVTTTTTQMNQTQAVGTTNYAYAQQPGYAAAPAGVTQYPPTQNPPVYPAAQPAFDEKPPAYPTQQAYNPPPPQ